MLRWHLEDLMPSWYTSSPWGHRARQYMFSEALTVFWVSVRVCCYRSGLGRKVIYLERAYVLLLSRACSRWLNALPSPGSTLMSIYVVFRWYPLTYEYNNIYKIYNMLVFFPISFIHSFVHPFLSLFFFRIMVRVQAGRNVEGWWHSRGKRLPYISYRRVVMLLRKWRTKADVLRLRFEWRDESREKGYAGPSAGCHQ